METESTELQGEDDTQGEEEGACYYDTNYDGFPGAFGLRTAYDLANETLRNSIVYYNNNLNVKLDETTYYKIQQIPIAWLSLSMFLNLFTVCAYIPSLQFYMGMFTIWLALYSYFSGIVSSTFNYKILGFFIRGIIEISGVTVLVYLVLLPLDIAATIVRQTDPLVITDPLIESEDESEHDLDSEQRD